MPRIKIKDLPKDQKISAAEMRAVLGGTDYLNQALLPQGEDLIKEGTIQLYGLRKLFGGAALYGGYNQVYGG
ncbi:MAG: hypothetical protein PVI66_15545 [Candidatus Aminicenantes bacterium]|jgi:hypothetical protein